MIISVIGAKGCGKNTVAEMVVIEAYTRHKIHMTEKSFALTLKDTIWSLYGSKIKDPERIYGVNRIKNQDIKDLPVSDAYKEMFPQYLENREFWTGRLLLQIFGTEIFRGVSDSLWVEKACESAKKTFEVSDGVLHGVIFTDCRFSNENEALYNMSKELQRPLVTIKVERPGGEIEDQHASEQGYQGIEYDYLVVNDGTLDDLNNKAEDLVNDIFGPRSSVSSPALRSEAV